MTKEELLKMLKKLRSNDIDADKIFIADEAIKFIEENCNDVR